jgi:exodeoxyribonuclease III
MHRPAALFMKIITWNCNMAFRRKAHLMMAQRPDLLIVPECEHPDKGLFADCDIKPSSQLWFGHNRNKGMGVFSFGELSLRVRRMHQPNFRMIVPLSVTGPANSFTLYAVWANNPDDPDGQYVEQIWKAINFYKRHLKRTNTILAGDFNSNTIWDKKYRVGNHSHVVRFLEKKGIHSCYHQMHGHLHGKELHPTLYMYRHQDKPYHIDYCFVSNDLAKNLQSVEVGEYDAWKQYSDHVPLIVTFGPQP